MARKPVSQSDTQWNAKGSTLSDGTVVKKGYLSQKGKDTKRVTGRVNLVTDTGRKKAGQTQKYATGNKVKPTRKTTVRSYGSSTSSTGKPTAATSSTTTTTGKPTAFSSTGTNKRNTYQTGRGQEAMQRAARTRQNAAARERRGMTSGTVTSAKKQTGRNPRVWDSMNPVQKTLTVLGAPLVGPIVNANRSASGQKDEYGKAYKPKPESVKRGITYYANGNARVWDPKLKKMITVSPNDRRHPKGKK